MPQQLQFLFKGGEQLLTDQAPSSWRLCRFTQSIRLFEPHAGAVPVIGIDEDDADFLDGATYFLS